MKNQKYRLIIITGLLVFCAFLILNFSTALAPVLSPLSSNLPSGLLNLSEACHIDGEVYEVKDAEGNLVTKMSRRVSVGDEILTGNGKHYKVTRVNGKNAIADFKGLDNDFIAWQVYFANQAIPVTNQESPNKIAIYHTHSEESYIPSDGTESIPGEGGIFKVGNVLREKLEAQGVEVVHAQSAHEPRDSNSYNRSRRTATELLRENPAALIDVHRDGVPDPDFYSKEIDGEGVTQIRLVVGRQNPKQAANEEFAKQIMAVVNENTPGLVKEIFY
ncbi:MAG: stage II sporulation protein P, partial [Clostridiaceae bacterium]|nr:stage II sporulation protein P [Clostridiaceae bacterium]